MNFTTLKADLLAQIGRAPSGLCYKMVTADINKTLRLHSMLKEVDLAAPYTLPSDFAEAQAVFVGDIPLMPATETARGRVSNESAAEFTVSDDNLLLDVDETSITLKYYAKFADLAEDDDTNTILTNDPGIYVYGVLAHHAALVRDPGALAHWKPIYENTMAAAQRADNVKRMSETAMAIKAPMSA